MHLERRQLKDLDALWELSLACLPSKKLQKTNLRISKLSPSDVVTSIISINTVTGNGWVETLLLDSRFVPCKFRRCTEVTLSELCAFPIKAENNDLHSCLFYSFFMVLQYNMCMALYGKNCEKLWCWKHCLCGIDKK